MAGNLDVIAKFITVDNINDVVERGMTALYFAAYHGKVEVVSSSWKKEQMSMRKAKTLCARFTELPRAVVRQSCRCCWITRPHSMT